MPYVYRQWPIILQYVLLLKLRSVILKSRIFCGFCYLTPFQRNIIFFGAQIRKKYSVQRMHSVENPTGDEN